jgi:hypothetical protein
VTLAFTSHTVQKPAKAQQLIESRENMKIHNNRICATLQSACCNPHCTIQLSDVPEFVRNCRRRFSEHTTSLTNTLLTETDALRHNHPLSEQI